MHGSIQLSSAAFACVGIMIVVGTHVADNRSNLGGDDVPVLWKVHVWLGYISGFFLLAQVRPRWFSSRVNAARTPHGGAPCYCLGPLPASEKAARWCARLRRRSQG